MLIVKVPKKNTPKKGTQFPVRLQMGPTYEVIDFYLKGGLTKAHLENIRVEVRGKPIQVFKNATVLDQINQAWKRPQAGRADLLRLWFYRPELDKLEQARNFALGTQDVDTVVITMDIAADAPDTADIDIKARVTAEQPLGVITKIKAFPQSFAQGGEQQIADIPTAGAAVAAMHFVTEHANHITLELDSLKVVDGSRQELHDAYSESLAAQTGFTHVSYLPRGDMFDALVTDGVQDFRVTVDLAQAATFPLVIEYFDSFSGL